MIEKIFVWTTFRKAKTSIKLLKLLFLSTLNRWKLIKIFFVDEPFI